MSEMRAPCRRLGSVARHLSAASVAAGGVTNRRVVLKSNPVGDPKPSDFEIVTETLPAIAEGQMLLKTKWLTLDPYMRGLDSNGFMNNKKNIRQTVVGGTVSEVLESRASGWSPGDLVVGYYGWQEYSIGTAQDIQWGSKNMPIEKWDMNLGPPSHALGVLGMTGYTAFHGMGVVARPKAGETVVVSAASGAVGQLVGQIAKIHGCRAVGVAGGPQKCKHCVEALGFDDCVDYKAPNFRERLAQATPRGIDVYFENVGGDVLEAVLPRLNVGARVPVCGWVSQYNTGEVSSTPMGKQESTPLARLQATGLKQLDREGNQDGFRFFSFMELSARQPAAREALQTMSGWIKEGKLKHREDVSQGLDTCVERFIGMLRGASLGKTMIQIS